MPTGSAPIRGDEEAPGSSSPSARGAAADSPYAGPRPFTEGQSRFFFGRERETADLYSLVVSHRVVLLYAQSGAGKTSLLQAGLLPRLRERHRIYGPARVSGLIPPEVNAADIANIYAFHVAQSWATPVPGVADDPKGAGPGLARTTLTEFLGLEPPVDPGSEVGGAEKRRGAPTVLIFDQLEEVFRLYPERWADRAAFFEQLRDVIEWGPHVRILLAMREDWVAELDPYTRLFWDRLHVRFRLECLRRPQALAAVTEPLARLSERRCSFAPDAADKLVTDLLTFRTVDAQGATVPVVGEFIEPVQLQVVCERLWQHLPADTNVITMQAVEQLGDANAALADFYAECIREAAQAGDVTEGVLRARFAKAFIGSGETRRMVPRGQGENGVEGVPVRALDALEARLLIRRESRGPHTWYELSHDRFVNPIVRGNEDWLRKLGPAAQQKTFLDTKAEQWRASAHRDASLLLTGRTLRKAERWRKSPAAVELGVSPEVDELLNASRRRLRRRKVFISGAVVIAVCLVGVAVAAYFMHRVTTNAFLARAAEQTAVARALLMDAARTEELAVQRKQFADSVARDAGEAEENARRLKDFQRERDRAKALREQAERAEADARTEAERARQLEQQSTPAFRDAWGFRQRAESLRYLDVWSLIKNPRPRTRAQDFMTVAKHIEEPDVRILVLLQALAVTPSDREVREALQKELGPVEELALLGPAEPVWGVAFRAGGREVATSDRDGRVWIWNTDTGKRRPFERPKEQSNAVAFSPDGALVATAGLDGVIRVWRLPTGPARVIPTPQCEGKSGAGKIFHLAFDPGGKRLAAAGEDGTARVWDVSTCAEVGSRIHPAPVFGVAFSPDGERLGTACADGMGRIWNISTDGPPLKLAGHTQALFSVAFHPRGERALTTSLDKTARVWDLRTGEKLRDLEGHTEMLGTGTFSPDGRRIATASADKSVRIWNADSGKLDVVLAGHTDAVFGVAFSADSSRLVTGSLDGTARIWSVGEIRGPSELPTWDQLVQRVRLRVPRELNPQECQKHLQMPNCPPPVKLP